jgi:hypothetical protein
MYIDASVFGGYFDAEFEIATRAFFEFVKRGRIIVLTSDIVTRELGPAPDRVRELARALPSASLIDVEVGEAALRLRDSYLRARVLGQASIVDATHVAIATVACADAIVSWNFKDIVRVDKIRAFNEVNGLEGYAPLTIVSPNEVHFDDCT